MIIPVNPYLASQYGATPAQVGLLLTTYSLFQFIFSPFWGALSDRFGRRPILLTTLAGGAVAYTCYGFATSLEMLFVARGLAGFFGANISTASAYIADITPPEDRAKGMGLVGAAFGLGFIFGPVLGGLLSHVGQQLGDQAPFGLGFSAIGAAVICGLNFFSAIFNLKESLPPEKRRTGPRPSRFKLLKQQFTRPVVGWLMLVFFLSGFAMAHMESSLGLFVKDVFQWPLTQASYAFAYVGVTMVFTQGFLIRKLIPRWGERVTLRLGLLVAAMGLAGISLTQGWGSMAVTMTLLGLGIGMANPSNLGTISLLTSPQEQGEVLGVTQSLSALGRILGPLSGGWIYGHFGQRAPFLTSGALMFLGGIIVIAIFRQLPIRKKTENQKASE